MNPQPLDLFRPSPCPCGTGPALLDYPEEWRIMTWCLCDDLVAFAAPTLPEVLGLWEGYNIGRVQAMGMMERGAM